MHKIERLYKLHGLLAGRRTPIPLNELMIGMECSDATIRRWMKDYREFFGAPLHYVPEARGWLLDPKWDRSFQMPGLWFKPEELHALLSANELLRQIELGLLAQEVAPLTERIRRILEKKGMNLSEVSQRVRLIPIGARPTPIQTFGAIAQAVLRRHRLSFAYQGRGRADDDPRVALPLRQVSPQRLVWYRSNWYLQAWCHQAEDFRNFALERIYAPRLDPEPALGIEDAELDAHFNSAYGIFGGPATDWAILRFSKQRARWIAEERWHPDQEGRFLPDGRYELRLPYSQSPELVMDILRHGADVEVVGPESLRTTVRRILREALRQYP